MFDFLNYIPIIGGFMSTVVPFVIVLSIVVAIHEYGHYIVGKWCGIHPEVFSLGFGPVLISRFDKHGTKWQVSAIPLGGYVRFLGDGDAASGPNSAPVDESMRHKTLNGAKLYKRVLTVIAGPVANFILSAVLFAGIAYTVGSLSKEPVVGSIIEIPNSQSELRIGDRVLAVNGTQVETFTDIIKLAPTMDALKPAMYSIERDGVQKTIIGPFLAPALVGSVMPVSPASKAGLKEGDVLLAADGVELHSFAQLISVISNSDKGSIDLKVWRDNAERTVVITPSFRDIQVAEDKFEKRMMIGVSSGLVFLAPINDIGIFDAIRSGVDRTYFVISSSLTGISQIITGKVGAENLQGPLGIAQMSGDTASTGLLSLITLIAFISSAIGFLNLLPIPVLDGGHLVLYAYEAIFRRPPSMKAIQIAMTTGMTLLLSLMAFATFNDLVRLF